MVFDSELLIVDDAGKTVNRQTGNYANQLGLGGLMFWELSEDVTSGATSLLDTIYDRVHLP